MKRAAARSEADEPARTAASRQRTVFAPSLATTTAAASSSPTLASHDDDSPADRSRALPRGVSSRRKFDVQVRCNVRFRGCMQLARNTLRAPFSLLSGRAWRGNFRQPQVWQRRRHYNDPVTPRSPATHAEHAPGRV